MSAGGSESRYNLNWAQTFICTRDLICGVCDPQQLNKKKRQEQLSIGSRVLKRPTHSALLLLLFDPRST